MHRRVFLPVHTIMLCSAASLCRPCCCHDSPLHLHQSIGALSQRGDCHLHSSCRPCRRHPGVEYVLDYVLERKRVDDMAGSIKSRRYDRQKFNMNMCGLRHLVYLVEGNPDTLGNESGRHHTPPSVPDTAHPAMQHNRLHASASCMLCKLNAQIHILAQGKHIHDL